MRRGQDYYYVDTCDGCGSTTFYVNDRGYCPVCVFRLSRRKYVRTTVMTPPREKEER